MSKELTQSTLIRGLQIIEKIVQAERSVSSAYLAEDLDLPKATVHRIAQQLEAEGFLQREPEGKRFTASRRLKDLAISTLSSSVINAHRHTILKSLSDELNETCNLTMLDGASIIYLDRVEANWPYRIHLPIGTRVPLHCTATGKLFLAHMRGSQRKRVLGNEALTRYTALTMTDMSELEQELRETLRHSIGYDRGEFIEDMIAIAVPIKNPQKQMCFSLAIHAPASRRSINELYDYLPILRRAAQQLARAEWGEESEA